MSHTERRKTALALLQSRKQPASRDSNYNASAEEAILKSRIASGRNASRKCFR